MENKFISLLGDAMKRGAFAACKRKLMNGGLSEHAAETACASKLNIKKDIEMEELDNDFLLLFVDAIDPTEMVGIIGGRLLAGRTSPAVGVPKKAITRLIKLIKNKKGLKVGHAGILPFLSSLPMKNLNLLQTKLEKLVTAEEQNLTAEELEKRAQYARMMKKTDSQLADDIEFGKPNAGLNNIIKAPIILAREMTQDYEFLEEDGSRTTETHFKPYSELQLAVINPHLEVPMLLGHKDEWLDDELLGYVKNIVADDKLRAIRGMGYFYESRCSPELLDALKKGLKIGVSIGFHADLGDGGLFNGKVYERTQKNIRLDHLAILLRLLPRCPLDLCGVNIKSADVVDNETFTVINKKNYYININKILEEKRLGKNSNNIKKVIDMKDQFVDPKSGKISGDEPSDLETMLTRMRKYLHGVNELEQKNFAIKKINEIIHMTDEGEETSTIKGDNIMQEKEYETAIAAKDAKITELTEIVKEALITEIKQFTTSKQQEILKLDDQCVTKLKTIRDTVISIVDISEKEDPEVIPVVSKEILKDEVKKEVDVKKYDVQELNAKINEEFDLDSIEWLD